MRLFKKPSKRGFTLVEVMVVVLITVMLTMLSVPIYKKNQDKNRYLAASGVLMELGNAVRMLQDTYEEVSCGTAVTANGAVLSESEAAATPTCTNLISWLQTNRYLSKIPFENGKYKGYVFHILTDYPQGEVNCGTAYNCDGKDGVACMAGDNSVEEYRCVWVDRWGNFHYN